MAQPTAISNTAIRLPFHIGLLPLVYDTPSDIGARLAAAVAWEAPQRVMPTSRDTAHRRASFSNAWLLSKHTHDLRKWL